MSQAKKNKAFVGGAWSDSEDDEQPPKEATCLMAQEKLEVPLNSSSFKNLDIIDLQKENEKLNKFNDDFKKKIEIVVKEKHRLEQEQVKFNETINELKNEVKTLKH